jgi:fumarate reductase iron-sulfur subunit
MADQHITLSVFRYRPGDDVDPVFQDYQVPYRDDWVVLDALNWIKESVDGTLAYRWSCRMGVCGSCGMIVNGKPKLACAAFLRDFYPESIRVEPLTNFPVERDLIITLDGFLEKLKSVKPWVIRDDVNAANGEFLQTPGQLSRFKQYSMCINCMLCYAACPVVGLEPKFVGPAALALGLRYNLDSRDQGNGQRKEVLGSDEGAMSCTFIGECTSVCPKNVDPAGAVQQEKVLAVNDWYASVLMPWGRR